MKQFTLRQVLIEVALFAGILASIRWVVTQGPQSEPEDYAVLVGWFCLCGAFIGGLYQRYWQGALFGLSVFFLLMILVFSLT